MALEDENKGEPSSDNGSVNRQECGPAKRQRKLGLTGTAENWERENNWTAGFLH